MSDCSTRDYSMPGISGRVAWNDGTESPITFARVVNGETRVAVAVELDGVVYERVVHCSECKFRDASHCSMTGDYTRAGDYCSFGKERR